MAESIGSVYVDVLPNADRFVDRMRGPILRDMDKLGRESGLAFRAGLQQSTRDLKVKVTADTTQARAQVAAFRKQVDTLGKSNGPDSLLKKLLLLAPAVIPLADGVAAFASGLVGLGVTGVLAFQGINRAMDEGTALGKKYQAIQATITQDMHRLQDTAAKGVLSGFSDGVAKVSREMPQLNSLVGVLATDLGQIGSSLLGAAAAGFNSFSPIIEKAAGAITDLAEGFERWVQSAQGQSFLATLNTDFDLLLQTLEELGGAIGALLVGFGDAGRVILDTVNSIAGLITPLAKIPGLVEAVTLAFVAFKVGGYISAGLTAASAGLVRLTGGTVAAAESANVAAASEERLALALRASTVSAGLNAAAMNTLAAASARASLAATGAIPLGGAAAGARVGLGARLGRLGGGLSAGLSRAAIPLIATYLGGSALRNHFKGGTKSRLEQSLHNVGDIFTGHFGDLFSSSGRSADLRNTQSSANSTASKNLAAITAQTNAYTKSINNQNKALADSVLDQLHSSASVSDGVDAFDGLTTSLQAQIDAQKDYAPVAEKNGITVQGVTYSMDAYQAALKQAGGDQVKAQAILTAHTLALQTESAQLSIAQLRQGMLTDAVNAATTKYGLTTAQVDMYAQALGITADELATGVVGQGQFVKAIGAVKSAIDNGSTAMQGWVAAVDAFNKAGDTAASRGQLIGAALVAANGDALGYANTMVQAAKANQQMVTDFVNLKSGVVNWKTGIIDFHNAAAAPLLSDLAQMQTAAMNAASATYQHEKALGDAGAADDAFKVYVNDTRGALIKQADQLGITKGQAKKLADQYFGIKNSGDLKKKIGLLGADKVQETLGGILQDLDQLTGNHHLGLYADTSQVTDALGNVRNQYNQLVQYMSSGITVGGGAGRPGGRTAKADGGFVSGPGTGTSDSIDARLSNGEFVVKASQTQRNRGLLEAINRGAPGFESGGFVGVDFSGSGSSGGSSSRSTASTAKKAAKAVKDLTSALQSLIGGIGSAPSSQIDINSTGVNRVEAQIGRARDAISAALRKGLSPKAAVPLEREIDKLAGQARRQLGALKVHIDTADVKALRASLKGTVRDVHDAFAELSADLAHAGVSGAQRSVLGRQNRHLERDVAARARIANKLATANSKLADARSTRSQEFYTVRDATAASFDITTSGTGFDGQQPITFDNILANATQDANKAKQYTALLKRLAGEGLSKTLLQQLAEAGPGALAQAQALGQATPKQIGQLNSQYTNLNAQGSSLAAFTAHDLYDAGVQAAEGLVNGLKSREKAIDGQMGRIAASMVARIKRDLGIHSPSRVFHELGAYTGEGLVNGMVSQLPAVRNAAGSIANAATPASQMRSWGGGQGSMVEQVVAGVMAQLPARMPLVANGRELARVMTNGQRDLDRTR